MPKRFQIRKTQVEILDVLLEFWDPLRLRHEPRARDAYDSYVSDLYDLLIDGKSDSELANYLYWAVNNRIGLSPPLGLPDMEPTVKALRKIPLPLQQ